MAEEETDTLFQDAVNSLREGDKAHAKEILTRLLKTDQNNSTYWVWMSAAVDTPKERVYCLQTALKLDPENGIAKRGLILLGALQPDENVQPFPLNKTRAWEEKLLLAHEKPKEKTKRVPTANPMVRLAGIVTLGIAVCGLSVYGLITARNAQILGPNTNTPGPSPTFTLTPTFVNATGQAGATRRGPTPLAQLFGVSYTATPLYVHTPRSPLAQDMASGARAAYNQGNWDEFIREMKQIQKVEPTAADVPYYIGEAYRFKGDCRTALDYYNQALKIDSNFPAGYIGLARARICMDPGASTTQLYDFAIQIDPNYGEAYLDRANFNLVRKDFNAALPDLAKADKLLADSPQVQLGFAQAYLLQGDNQKALAAAQKANDNDLTLLPSYYYLGKAYIANNQFDKAIKPLQTYLLYETQDGSAYFMLGQALTQIGDFQDAISALNQGLEQDPSQVRSYIFLGVSDLGIDDLDNAEYNFKKAIQYFPDSFDANIGLTETFYRKETYGNAYLQAETAKSKATSPAQTALAIYWRALSQEGRGSYGDAMKDWNTLLSMPPSAVTAQMRKDAQDHLKKIVTPTRTPKVTATLTPKPSSTSGSAAATSTPKVTPTVTATKKP